MTLRYKLGSGAVPATLSEEMPILIFWVVDISDFLKNQGEGFWFQFSYACKIKLYNFQVTDVFCVRGKLITGVECFRETSEE